MSGKFFWTLSVIALILVAITGVYAAEKPAANAEAAKGAPAKKEALPVIEAALPFLFFGLALGCVLQQVLKSLPRILQLPYTVSLFLIGIGIAALQDALRKSHALGHLGESVDEMTKIDPKVILFVLLPPLLFESALAINWHVFKRVAASSLLLAFPGVAVSTVLTAAYFMAVSGYGWTWAQALVIGSALSATDPVAVVAALQSLGAPARISTLVDGEALLNDGSAFVLFLIFMDFVAGTAKPAMGIIGFFFQLALGGAVFGVIMAFFTSQFLKLVFNDPFIETTALLISVYATFFVGEEVFHVSSVLAVVCFGLYMSYRGKYNISSEIEHHFHHNIAQIAYWANTFLFLVAGILTYEKLSISGVSTNPINWAVLFGLYLACYVIRFISIAVFFPILSRIGYGLKWKDVMFLVYAGLRGGVSITLALLLELNSDIKDKKFQGLVAFHVAGIVLLTILINGSTSDKVYENLQLDIPSPFLPQQVASALESLEHEYRKKERKVRKGWLYRYADWDIVMTIVPDLTFTTVVGARIFFNQTSQRTAEEENEGALSTLRRPGEVSNWRMTMLMPDVKLNEKHDARKSMFPRAVSVPMNMQREMENHINSIYLNAVKAEYHHQFEHGYLGGEAMALLDECALMAQECGLSSLRNDAKYSTDLPESKKIEQEFHFITEALPVIENNWRAYMEYPLIGRIAKRKVSSAIATTVEILSGYIHAHQHSLEHTEKIAGEVPYISELRNQVDAVCDLAKAKLRQINEQYPIILRELLTVMASKYLIHAKRELVEDFHSEGFLDDKIQQQLIDHLEKKLCHLHHFRPNVSKTFGQDDKILIGQRQSISSPNNLGSDKSDIRSQRSSLLSDRSFNAYGNYSPRTSRFISVLYPPGSINPEALENGNYNTEEGINKNV
ncbi:Sodium/hydrogen exchanger family-domain-containing protein [Paraphysoderma sedebokerense]|nr:Sodium/hydrogen exchanger family-domain-containing protein [Paraphysoderma sedebokerense]